MLIIVELVADPGLPVGEGVPNHWGAYVKMKEFDPIGGMHQQCPLDLPMLNV